MTFDTPYPLDQHEWKWSAVSLTSTVNRMMKTDCMCIMCLLSMGGGGH